MYNIMLIEGDHDNVINHYGINPAVWDEFVKFCKDSSITEEVELMPVEREALGFKTSSLKSKYREMGA